MATLTCDPSALRYLKERDPILGAAIDLIGPVSREVDTDLFEALVNTIVGQQISTKAHQTVWQRIRTALGEVTPETILSCSDEELQAFGISFRKVGYIKGAAARIARGELDLDSLSQQSDGEVAATLSALPGIGVWTAEMLMTFSMGRPDIFSFGDLAIHRGLRMLYHHRKVDKKLFERYRRRYSPHASAASLYLWAVAGGAIPGLRDYAPKQPKKAPPAGAPKKT